MEAFFVLSKGIRRQRNAMSCSIFNSFLGTIVNLRTNGSTEKKWRDSGYLP